MEKRRCLRQKCGVEFTPTKPKQKYCSTKCRTYAHRESKIENPLEIPIPHIPPSKREVVEQVVKDFTKPTNQIKPQEQPKSNFTIDTRPEEPHKPQQLSTFMQRRQQIKNGNK